MSAGAGKRLPPRGEATVGCRRTAALLCAASWASLATGAAAQTAPPPTPQSAQIAGPSQPKAIGTTGASSGDAGATVQEVIVTAQKRSESLQSVPIAVTALTGDALKAQQIDSGGDLVLAVPNLSFSRSSFSASNYQIRGVGYQLVTTTGEQGVGVHENNTPLVINTLSDADFFDIERVEVLRGPQGTLYGRNSTGGVINIITAKPTPTYSAELTGEYGNYDTGKVKGYVNLPLGDMFALRVAGSYVHRDGFQTYVDTGQPVDGRDLYSTRVSLSFKPNSKFSGLVTWEHYKENDDRTTGARNVCLPDPGPSSIGGVAVNAPLQAYLSRGCALTSVYSPGAANHQVDTIGDTPGHALNDFGVENGNSNATVTQSNNLREVMFETNPQYNDHNDFVQLDLEYALTPALKFISLSAGSYNNLTTRDTVGSNEETTFNNTAISPGGFLNDPQLGRYNYEVNGQYDAYKAQQFTQELRLQSSFNGPVNFNLGGIYIDLHRHDYVYIFDNGDLGVADYYNNLANAFKLPPIAVDPNSTPQGIGGNYFYSDNPYQLFSKAVFGEAYYQPLRDVKITLGLRYTDDDKVFDSYGLGYLQPGVAGLGALTRQEVKFKEFTGRANIDWTPHLPFTNSTLVYFSYSRGYKAGGFNPPNVVATAASYAPEFVNAYEIGTKNELLGRSLTLNLTAFHYDYQNYQTTQVAGLTTFTSNIGADIDGLELESVWAPLRGLRFNTNLGYLDTSIKNSSLVDPNDPVGGDPNSSLVKGLFSSCIAPSSVLASIVGKSNAGDAGYSPSAIVGNPFLLQNGLCGGTTQFEQDGAIYSGPNQNVTNGNPINLKGKNLPQSPHLTASVGGQYTYPLPREWLATLRADFYRQSSSYATIYNEGPDLIKGWSNINLSLIFNNAPFGVQVQGYVKNLLDADPITSILEGTSAEGFAASVLLNDPRTYGVEVTKRF